MIMIKELSSISNTFVLNFQIVSVGAIMQIQTIADAASATQLLQSGGVLAVLTIAAYVLWMERKNLLASIMASHKEEIEKRDQEIAALRKRNDELLDRLIKQADKS